MSVDQKNRILYIGTDEEYAASLATILNYQDSDFYLETLIDVEDIQNSIQNKNIGALIFDSNVMTNNDQTKLEQVLKVTGNTPFVMLVDKGQEDLGQYAMEKGAFDYLVKVEGAISSVPFTIDRALEFKPKLEKVAIDFQVESDLEEQTSFFEINESGRFLTCDDYLTEIVGIQKHEFYKSYLMDFVADEDRSKFYEWRASSKRESQEFLIQTEIIHREKGIIPVELQLETYSRPESLFSGFRGYLKIISSKKEKAAVEDTTELLPFFQEIYKLNSYLRQGYRQLFTMRLTEIPHKFFHFSHAALFLFSAIKNEYRWELSIGESVTYEKTDLRSDRFDAEEIKRLFSNDDFVRFAHQSVLNEEEREKIHGSAKEELFQEKSWEPGENWNIGDRLFINIKNPDNSSFGFIVLERPELGKIPARAILRQAELYSIFISSLYESDVRLKDVENKYKQFKQIFTILETFDIELPLEGLLKEIVWTIKFSLGFNLAALAIISKASRMLHIKAVAVEGKEKGNILSRLHFTLQEISPWLKNKYRLSRSYLISDTKSPFHLLKRIYGLPLAPSKFKNQWRNEDLLLIPIRMENQKIIGFLILDDPDNKLRPSIELIQVLEKIAKLVATTITNKVVYTRLKLNIYQIENPPVKSKNSRNKDENSNRIKKIFKRMSF